jgi:hypothetical protein
MAKITLYDKKLMDEFGKDYVKILIRLLKKEGKDATGALINSISYKLRDTAGIIQYQLIANDYLQYVDEGRRPGSYPPMRAISDWVRVKGISKDAIFPIMRSIYTFGIEPTNVIKNTLNEIKTSPTLQKKYEDTLEEQLEKLIEAELIKLEQ